MTYISCSPLERGPGYPPLFVVVSPFQQSMWKSRTLEIYSLDDQDWMGYRHARLKALFLLSARGVELSERSYGNVEYPGWKGIRKEGQGEGVRKKVLVVSRYRFNAIPQIVNHC